jgi:UDP-N-acetylglucosamine 2-epimerase (non-hydrolysing)
LVGTQTDRIVTSASELLSDRQAYLSMANAINPFGDGYAAERILKIVRNYLGLTVDEV